MRSLIFAGIQRYSLFSPNHVGNDAAIFSAVAQYLKENGHQVNMYTEQEFLFRIHIHLMTIFFQILGNSRKDGGIIADMIG